MPPAAAEDAEAVTTEATADVAVLPASAPGAYMALDASRSLASRPLISWTTPCFCVSSVFCVLMRSIGARSSFIRAVTIEAVSIPLPSPLKESAGAAVVPEVELVLTRWCPPGGPGT